MTESIFNQLLESKLIENHFDDVGISRIGFGELYCQAKKTDVYCCFNSKLFTNSSAINGGASFSLDTPDATFSFSTSDLNIESILKLIKNPISGKTVIPIKRLQNAVTLDSAVNLDDTYKQKKRNQLVQLLLELEKKTISQYSIIIKYSSNIIFEQNHTTCSNNTHSAICSKSYRITYGVSVVVSIDNKAVSGFSGFGADVEDLFSLSELEFRVQNAIKKATKHAIHSIQGVKLEPQSAEVILGPGLPAIFFHETIGHMLEGDNVTNPDSIFHNALGTKVAHQSLTIIDDPTVTSLSGSYHFDDQGTKAVRKTLIKNGCVNDLLLDRKSSKKLGLNSNGSARRMSFEFSAQPRMSNTFIERGNFKSEEILKSTQKGLYIKSFGDSRVNQATGKFSLLISEGYVLENGKIGQPITGNRLTGCAIDVLPAVTMIGDDFEFDNGLGSCIKNKQILPVSVGQPTLKLNKINVI